MTRFSTVNNGWQYLTLHNVNIFLTSEFNKAFETFWRKAMSNVTKQQVVGLIIRINSKKIITVLKEVMFYT